MRYVRRAIRAFFLLIATGSASAQFSSAGLGWVGLADSPAAPAILYVNGIHNSSTDSATSSQALRDLLVSEGLPESKFKHYYFWNPTDWAKGRLVPGPGVPVDVSEVALQAAISADVGVGPTDSTYKRRLGDRYLSLVAGLKELDERTRRVVQVTNLLKQEIQALLELSRFVVIVPHSQGNLYVEAAYAMLFSDSAIAGLVDRIRVVGVASAAASTPNGVYITHKKDYVIQGLLRALQTVEWSSLSGFRPLSDTHSACRRLLVVQECLEYGHGFETTYLNDNIFDPLGGQTFPAIINYHVRNSITELESNGQPSKWSAVADFSLSANQSGPWSYGFDGPARSLTPMGATKTNCSNLHINCWITSAGAIELPLIGVNNSGSTINGGSTVVIPTGMLVLHPGFTSGPTSPLGYGLRPIVTWTAPEAGTYTISGRFQILDVIPTGVRAIVQQDGVALVDVGLNGYGNTSPFALNRSLNKGQVISFIVDAAGSHGNDSTGLVVSITRQ